MRLRIAFAVAFVTLCSASTEGGICENNSPYSPPFVQGEGARDHLRALVNHNVQSGGALEKGCNGKGGQCSKNKDCCESEGLSCGRGGKCGGCNAEGVKCDTNGECCEGLSCGVGMKCSTCNGKGGNCVSDGNCCGDLVCQGGIV
jgi:hypothetical protein